MLLAISASALLGLVIWLLCIGIIIWLVFWILGQFPMPEPIGKIIKIVIVVIAVILVINILMTLVGNPLIVW